MHGTSEGHKGVVQPDEICWCVLSPPDDARPATGRHAGCTHERGARMALDAAHWQDRLTTLAEKRGVVGATFAIGLGDETITAATGVLNLRSAAPATPDSVFQIGSITKVWTAVL